MGSIQSSPEEQVWDRHTIKAAIERECKSLTNLARLYNMPPQTIRNALDNPSKSGELVIADFLEKPVYELFPDRWTEDNKRIYPRTLKRKQ